MDFVEYLTSKKIDAALFLAAEPEVYREWERIFPHMHPDGFTAQKLYLINPIRRRYKLQEVPKTE